MLLQNKKCVVSGDIGLRSRSRIFGTDFSPERAMTPLVAPAGAGCVQRYFSVFKQVFLCFVQTSSGPVLNSQLFFIIFISQKWDSYLACRKSSQNITLSDF